MGGRPTLPRIGCPKRQPRSSKLSRRACPRQRRRERPPERRRARGCAARMSKGSRNRRRRAPEHRLSRPAGKAPAFASAQPALPSARRCRSVGAMSAFLLASLLICAGAPDPAPGPPCIPLPANWRRVAAEGASARRAPVRDAWVVALAQARADHAAEIAAGGILFDPDAAMLDSALPVGDYDCRTIKLGAQASGHATYVAYPVEHCRI